MEALVRAAIAPLVMTELHPRSHVTVVIQVITNAGSLLAVSINAAALALMDAGACK